MKTRASILKNAKEIFSENGYSSVTMKNFSDKLGLSRAAIYRYFDSTKDIFTTMLDEDIENTIEEIENGISIQKPAKEILLQFLDDMKEQMEMGKGAIELVIYEFCRREKDQSNYIQNRFNTSVRIFEKLIRYGQMQQEFRSCDANETAKRIVFLLEGISLASNIITFDENLLEQQLHGIYEMVICEK